jgi:hypothetical protein
MPPDLAAIFKWRLRSQYTAFGFVLQLQFRKSVNCSQCHGLERLAYLIKQDETYLTTFNL